MTMLVHELLSRSAASAPDAVAVAEPGASITYQALERRARGVALALREAGIQRGDRVVLALQNSIEFVAGYFGILMAGAVAVPLQPGARSDRVPKAIEDCEPSAAIVDESTWPRIAGMSAACLRACFVVRKSAEGSVPSGAAIMQALDAAATLAEDGAFEATAVDSRDLAAIIYTSGSTGAPRGVMLTHRNITANTESIVTYLGLSARDRVMVVLPFYYVYGMSLLHTHVAVGGCLVIDNRFAFPNAVLRSMREQAVTGFAGVPSTFALLLHRSNIRSMSFPALRYVTQAGGPMPPARIHEWLRVMPEVPFYVMYGATEASARLTYLPPWELPQKAGSIGRAIPGVEVRVIRDDGIVAAVGEVGELVARGANIARGYWNRPAESAEQFGREGYRTGDLGFADEDGCLYLVGRRTEMLKVGAHRVSPVEIEQALHEHPAVHEAAVLGAPDDLLGEVAVAYVALLDGETADAQALLTFARNSLPEHKVPARITVLPELPKTATGKLDKAALRQREGLSEATGHVGPATVPVGAGASPRYQRTDS